MERVRVEDLLGNAAGRLPASELQWLVDEAAAIEQRSRELAALELAESDVVPLIVPAPPRGQP